MVLSDNFSLYFATDPKCLDSSVSTVQPTQTVTVCPSRTQTIHSSSIPTQPQHCSGELTRVFFLYMTFESDLRLRSSNISRSNMKRV